MDFVVKAFSGRPVAGNADEPRLDPQFVGDFVRPRFIPGTWMKFLEVNTRLKSAIEEIATASVGLGVRGVPDPDELELLGESSGKIRRNKLLEAARRLTLFCRRPKANSFLPLSWELGMAEVDYLGSGDATLEIIEEGQEAGGPVMGLGHVRSAMMRVNPERTRWVQAMHSESYHHDQQGVLVFNGRFYRSFGDDHPERRFINKYTGQFYAQWPSNIPDSYRGTAILHAKSYCPLDPYYGMPVHVPAMNAIIENDMMAKFMLAFLKSGTQVPILVIAEGCQLTAASSEKIEALFNSDSKGLDNAGRAAIIQPTITAASGTTGKIRIERVELGIKDLAPLFERRATNDGEVLETTRMSGIFIGGTEGGATTTRNAAVLKQLSFEHAIEPRAKFWEAILTNGLAPSIAPGAAFACTRPKNLDPLQVATLIAKLRDAVTVNDMRAAVRTLVNGVDMPVLKLGPDGDLPLVMLKAKQDQELASMRPATPDPAQDPAEPDLGSMNQEKPLLKLLTTSP